MKKPRAYYTGMLVVLLASVIPLFAHLDAAPIHIWDEARLAISALEMRHSHNWLLVTVNGMPDMWSTKPPLMIWLQALSLGIVGINELAIRLPAALAALATCLLLYWLFAKKGNAPLAGVIAVLVLLTSHGYVGLHCSRSGDYDSLLTLLTTGYCLAYFLYLEEEKKKYLLLTFVMLILAALTKGIQSLMFLPGLLIYTVYRKKILFTLKQPAFYIGILCFVLLVPGYYLLREHYNPGYIQAVMQNEIGGRYNKVIESHTGDQWHYFDALVNDQFRYWYLLIIPGFMVGIVSREQSIRNLTVFAFSAAFIYFLIISGSSTQLDWYSMPIFPFVSVLVTVFIYAAIKALLAYDGWKSLMRYNVLPYALLVVLFANPYCNMANLCLAKDYEATTEPQAKKDLKLLLKGELHGEQNIAGQIVDFDEPDISWYGRALAAVNKPVKMIKRDSIDPHGTIIVAADDTKNYIQSQYNAQVIGSFNNVTIYKLYGRKN